MNIDELRETFNIDTLFIMAFCGFIDDNRSYINKIYSYNDYGYLHFQIVSNKPRKLSDEFLSRYGVLEAQFALEYGISSSPCLSDSYEHADSAKEILNKLPISGLTLPRRENSDTEIYFTNMVGNNDIVSFSLTISGKKSAKRNKKELKDKGFVIKNHYF